MSAMRSLERTFLRGSCASASFMKRVAAEDNAKGRHRGIRRNIVLTLAGPGAQVYECRRRRRQNCPGYSRTSDRDRYCRRQDVGRHYAGPNWHTSTAERGWKSASATAPGATQRISPGSKLEVGPRLAAGGILSGVTTGKRIQYPGGKIEGKRGRGKIQSAPY